MTQLLTGAQFKAMILNASAAIENHKTEVNELNVFPVPDGDTGTNMSLTLSNGAKMLAGEEPRTVSRAAEITANALLRGARGNSGVILSLLFRGVARRLKDFETADAALFAASLRDGVEAAYKAVMKPAEGTILTVSRLAADAAVEAAEAESDLEIVLERTIEAGKIALADTINQNPVLKKAGVIDSGGKGYIYILDGMLRALRGEIIESGADADAVGRDRADFSQFTEEDLTFGYEVVYIVTRETGKSLDLLRAFLNSVGDSIVIADDDDLIKVHVHTDSPGEVIADALTYGSIQSAQLENLREQQTEKSAESRRAEPQKKYGAVAVCSGEGLEAVFRDLGADTLVTGGQTMNPSTDDILAAVEQTPAEIVFIYPNNKNIIMAAEQAVPLSDKRIVVVPTKSIPQGVAAMLAFDTAADAEENLDVMKSAISRVRTILITHAARDSVFDGHEIHEGEFLALLGDALLHSGDDFSGVADAVVSALTEQPPEFVTVFSGEGSSDAETARLLGKLSALPDIETTVVDGGQPVYRYVISAE
ncbi:MAG: DAK2 domain-containing protein [Oscillospiraceae bacterium]|nr:DAK2 domain-containing protein [Oscillospiraceae bacterium]